METIRSIIRFVNVDPIPTPENTPGTETGDMLGIIFLCIISFTLLFLLFLKVFVANTKYKPQHASILQNTVSTKFLILTCTLVSVCALVFSIVFNIAFAESNQLNYDNEKEQVVTDEFINANVSKLNGTVVIDDAHIVNNSDNTIKFCNISTELIGQKLEGNWTIYIDGNLVYNAKAGEQLPIEQDIYLAPNNKIDVCISTDISIDKAAELIDQDVLKINYTYDYITEITGQVINSKGKPLPGIKTDLYNQYYCSTTYTDTDGYYHFYVVKDSLCCVKFSDHNRQDNNTEVVIADKNIDFGTLTLLAKALINFNCIGTSVVDEAGIPITRTIELKECVTPTFKYKINIEAEDMYDVSSSDNYGDVYFSDEDGVYFLDCPEVDLLITCKAIKGLDYYTIEDSDNKPGLKSVSDDISAKGYSSLYYGEFVTYAHKDEIWYSNSNGQQPDYVSPEDPSCADVSKCNQNYRNDFNIDESIIPPENQELDRFMFLRVIGVYQDKEAFNNGKETGKVAGITFQSIRSLPRAYAFSEDPNYQVDWWGSPNCFLRNDLSDNGDVFPKLSQFYRDNILLVSKKSQSVYNSSDLDFVRLTGDKLFILSYSEMCTPGTEADRFLPFQYYMSGAEGQQYIWYQNQQINGGSNATYINEKIQDLGKVNSGENISGTMATTHQRTTYYADQYKFLLTNNFGFIYSYDSNFLQRSGIAPCFCFGDKSKTSTFNLETHHCNITNLDDEVLTDVEQVLAHDDFKFKVKKHEGYSAVDVTCDGIKILPDASGVYKISKSEGTYNIKAEGIGGPLDANLKGIINIEKNLPSGVQIAPRINTAISFVTTDGQVLASGQSDDQGKYYFRIDAMYLGTTGNLVLNYMPGVLTYHSDLVTLTSGDIIYDIYTHGLDFYTLAELKEVSNWLGAHKDDTDFSDSPIYKEFYSYVENDVIWYSNSNGLQPSSVTYKESQTAIPELCNQEYKCSFENPNFNRPVSHEIDQFIFLRIIGINHDLKTDGDGYAGLTLQTIHAVPFSEAMPSDQNSWWGNSKIRPMLQEGGVFYNELNPNITKEICPVIKYSQTARSKDPNIQETTDQIFLLSYSEMWDVSGVLVTDEHPWYGNTGVSTEGYTYLWHHLNHISGGDNNDILSRLPVLNSGEEGSDHQRAWERSVCCDNPNYFLATESHGSIINSNFDFSNTVFNICFCL